MSLKEYNSKRDFTATKEPKGAIDKTNQHRFVIQRHEARRLHYDFRLEMNGVLKSWAVPKGPSMNSGDKRFAVMTEDHPVAYLGFKGVIPEKHYGGGFMEIWDKGKFMPVDEDMNPLTDRQATAALEKGELKIFLKGKQIEGGYVLIRLKNDDKNWLLIKHNDEYNVRKPFDAENLAPISRKEKGKAPKKATVKETGELKASVKASAKKAAKGSPGEKSKASATASSGEKSKQSVTASTGTKVKTPAKTSSGGKSKPSATASTGEQSKPSVTASSGTKVKTPVKE